MRCTCARAATRSATASARASDRWAPHTNRGFFSLSLRTYHEAARLWPAWRVCQGPGVALAKSIVRAQQTLHNSFLVMSCRVPAILWQLFRFSFEKGSAQTNIRTRVRIHAAASYFAVGALAPLSNSLRKCEDDASFSPRWAIPPPVSPLPPCHCRPAADLARVAAPVVVLKVLAALQ